MADHARGRVLAGRGAIEQARASFEGALAGYTAVGAPYDVARVAMAIGGVLAAEAARIFGQLGAAGIES